MAVAPLQLKTGRHCRWAVDQTRATNRVLSLPNELTGCDTNAKLLLGRGKHRSDSVPSLLKRPETQNSIANCSEKV